MSTEAARASSELTMCPSCGAVVDQNAKKCWLCKADLSDEIITAEVVAAPATPLDNSTTKNALIAGTVTLGLVTVGVFVVAPGIGIPMGILFVIATFAVAKSLRTPHATAVNRTAIEQAYSSPTATTATSKGSVIGTVFMVLGMIGLLAVAAVIALFSFCVICVMAL